jgi:hypothetical protein
MNLIFHMLYVFLLSQFRESLSIGNSVSRLGLRVLPERSGYQFSYEQRPLSDHLRP